jgi:hypothetical protein
MPRATSKAELLAAANAQYEKLWKLLDSMTEAEQTAAFLFEDRDKNLRDILIHLYEWHNLLLNCVKANANGGAKPFLPEPYNWRTYPQMNVGFWEKHQSTPCETAKSLFCESHQKVTALIERFSDEALFTKKRFPWTGASTLGSYCVSATASHYDCAMKKIKRHIKAHRER